MGSFEHHSVLISSLTLKTSEASTRVCPLKHLRTQELSLGGPKVLGEGKEN